MRVRWVSAAEQDRTAIFEFIARDNPLAAIDLDEHFEKAADMLALNPEAGKQGIIQGTRELIPHKSYRLVYEIEHDTVWILALVHTARLWPPSHKAS